jgi:hypothetical protein
MIEILKKYKIYPSGYNPMMEMGPPSDDTIRLGINWTPEDTQKVKELKEQARIMQLSYPPRNCYYEVLDN